MKSPEFIFKTQNSKFNIDWDAVEQEAARLLSRYLQFDTTNPPGNELEAINFLAEVLRDHGFAPQVIESAPGRAIIRAERRRPSAHPVHRHQLRPFHPRRGRHKINLSRCRTYSRFRASGPGYRGKGTQISLRV